METTEPKYQVYGYRWVILIVYFLINLIIQVQWLTFAPIAREARTVYAALGFADAYAYHYRARAATPA